ncbi:hypothetical protein CEE37_11655 [candidate division LCP-89 bacterium B3_LCP]|uniref:Uncharacterized protein n=1 Tax=candidate division LCP-89 bacterium B3_LCP TaxID=2012998 RepID=A0A532UVZ8_UNCL8|nr:MAG: hypothetical protein CEE37_11655 [candidate division LCP-89 bacterium B3_LCP]
MELIIGSNVIRNTSGVLNIQGEEQIFLELGKNNQQLLLTIDVYDENRKHIAKLRRNAWAFNEKDRFNITTNPKSLTLIDKKTKEILVEARVLGVSKIEIVQGKIYTHTGQLLEIAPQYWRIGGITLSGNNIDSCGGAVSIE